MVSHYKFEYHDAPAVSIITKVDDDESLSGELMVANWKIRKALNGKITMADGHLYNVEMLWE
jgi:ribosomal protein L18E